MIQLDFTKTPEEQEKEFLLDEIKRMRESQDKVRRKLFAQMGEVMKEYHAIKDEFEAWKRAVCKEEIWPRSVKVSTFDFQSESRGSSPGEVI